MTASRIAVDGYDVVVQPGVLDELRPWLADAAPAHRYVLVTDTTVERLHVARVRAALEGAEVDVVAIPPGEREKSRDRWAWITDRLLDGGHGRDSVVLALGGGVIGDLAGFTAATFMRGIPIVQLPTTLLAMVDASVGGKTALDVPAGKNLVGAFHPPALVLVDPTVLATLPARDLRAGMAEVLKHGIIADAGYLAETVDALPELLDPAAAAGGSLAATITRSVRIKAGVVRADPREDGLRRILNFGHTLGHAVEQASGYALLHGEAVAIGMSLEAVLAERLGVAVEGTAEAVSRALRRAGLPIDLPASLGVDAEGIVALTRSDKKARRGSVEYALPADIGRMAGAERGWGVPVPEDDVLGLLRERLDRRDEGITTLRA